MYEGIRQLFFCEKGYLSQATPQGVVAWGLGNLGSFIYEDVPIIGEQEEDFPNAVNFKIKANSLQGTIRDLDWMVNTFCKMGAVDCQVVTEKEASAVYGGVYNFEYTGVAGPDKFMGFDFEWVESSKERYLSLMGEVSLPEELAKEIIQSSLVNTPKDLYALSYGNRGRQPANYKKPYFDGLYSPDGTVLVNGSQVVDYKFTIKSIGKKLDYDRSDVSWVNVNLVLTVNKSRGYDLAAWYNQSRYDYLEIIQRNSASSVNTYTFAEGILWRKHKVNIDGKNRNVELTFNKNLPLADLSINSNTNTVSVLATV